MPVDTNEIGGFILNCTNVGYLRDLEANIRARLHALGDGPPPKPTRPLVEPTPPEEVVPENTGVRPSRPTPPVPEPAVLAPVAQPTPPQPVHTPLPSEVQPVPHREHLTEMPAPPAPPV